MNGLMKKVGLGVALAATALTAAAPAEAQRWRGGGYRHYDRGGNVAAGAVLGGIVGLGIGAAIASGNRGRYYDRGYYGGGGYVRGGYGGYDRGYYPRGGYYDYRQDYRPRCWIEPRYDPYYGGRVDVRVCG